MSRDHPVDSYSPALSPALPAAPFRRHSSWLMDGHADEPSGCTTPSAPAIYREPSISAQAREIIDTVLADSDPRLEEIRRCLRKNVAAHPGCPSRALLAHLLETRRLSNAGS